MAFSTEFSGGYVEDYRRLCSKNRPLKLAVDAKVRQICGILEDSPSHYKPLKAPLAGVRRAHVADSFVLLFEVFESTRTIRLLGLAHHDEAYLL